MDYKRITSGMIVTVVLAVILLIQNSIITGILFTIITLMAMYEYLEAISKVSKPIKWLGYVSCIIVALINCISEQYIKYVLMFSIPSILLILYVHIIVTDMEITFKDVAYTFVGICYIPFFFMFLSLINGMEKGKFLLGYVFMAAWGTDVFAYCVGMKLGKHKFSKVSPKKSIEGCIGGVIGAVLIILLYTFILNKYLLFDYGYFKMFLFGVVLSLIGQLGDFSASAIKRYVDIKDYSNLLPGHGGVLDRIDSVLFIAPFAYMLFVIV